MLCSFEIILLIPLKPYGFVPLVQRLPAELSFEQITADSSAARVREVFATAFQAVEEAFLESIDHCIAERTQLLDKIPEDMPQLEAARRFPETLSRLQVGGNSCWF